MVNTLEKKRCNFLISKRAKNRLQEISDNSVKYFGRSISMSQIIEYFIDRAFLDKKNILSKEITNLRQQLISMEAEWEALNLKEKKVNDEWMYKNEIRTQTAEDF